MKQTIHIFTDASFDKKYQLAVSGYLLQEYPTPSKKEATPVVLQSFCEQNNIRAELRGAIEALKVSAEKRCEEINIRPDSEIDIILYTDCESIAGLPDRQRRLKANQFLSKKSGKPLNNADLYHEFFEAYNNLRPTVEWIKGHNAKNKRNLWHEEFRRVDIAVRQRLRSLLNDRK